jgi:hypothetical protein
VLGALVLKGTQVRPRAVSERQIGDVRDPDAVGLGGLGLVEQPVGGTAQAMGRISGARGEGFGLQRVQALPAHGPAQAQAAHPVAFFPQGNPQPAGAVAATVDVKDLKQWCFPGGCLRVPHRPLLACLPGVVALAGTPSTWHSRRTG